MSKEVNWRAVIWAGIIAGIVFMMLEMVLVATVGGGSLWGPPRMIGAMVLGSEVLPPPATFEIGVMLVAMLVHLIVSLIYAAILGWAISRWHMSLGTALVVGIVFGLVVYFVDFYLFTAIWPWFATARNWISIFSHAMYGLVLAWVYHAMIAKHLHRLDR